jgi:hypothetical protein
MATPTPINFVLNAFSGEVTMDLSGALSAETVSDLSFDAVAILEVSKDIMQDVFKFQTDSYSISNVHDQDVKYYVYNADFIQLNAANGMMDYSANGYSSQNPIATNLMDGTTPIASNKMLVVHDYLRYLPQNLFGSHHGVDLFSNQTALIASLRGLAGADASGSAWDNINVALNEVGAENSALISDGNGGFYKDNSDATDANVCRELMLQIAEYDPSRFAAIQDTAEIQPVPLVSGDSISFTLGIEAAADQHLLTGVNAIPKRTYKVRLVLVDTPANTGVDTANEAADSGRIDV